jgi:low temperature requirement protein LtrA
VAPAIGFTGAVALWWCYFQRADDARLMGWSGTLTPALIVLAVIASAVGDKLAIAHPGDDSTLGFTIRTFGGPALFLLARVVFLGVTLGHVPSSRLPGLGAQDSHRLLAGSSRRRWPRCAA